jgi:hypothetical protein
MPRHQGGRRSLAEMWQFVMNGPTRSSSGVSDTGVDMGPRIDMAHATSAEPPLQPVAAPQPRGVVPAAAPVATPPMVQPMSYVPKVQPATPAVTPKTQPKPAPVVPSWGSVTPAQPPAQAPVMKTPLPTPGPAVQPVQPAVSLPQAQPQAQLGSAVHVPQMLQVLRDSPYPEQREWAAERLSSVSGPMHHMVVQAVVKAAKEDAAPTVQVACIRCLVKLNHATQEVTTALTSLKGDADPRVRHEAGQALVKFSAGQAVQPASYSPGQSR